MFSIIRLVFFFFNDTATTEIYTLSLHDALPIRVAGKKGARLIGFPEGFIPAHPVWYHHHPATGAVANELAVLLFRNAVEIPGPEIDALCAAAREANAYVVMGVCEKLPRTIGTMFNTQVYIGPDGRLLGKHQKLVPTVG